MGGAKESAAPIVGFDYAFLSDRQAKPGDEEDAETASDGIMKMLIAHDGKSMRAAIPVPQKGIDQEEWSVKESLRFLD